MTTDVPFCCNQPIVGVRVPGQEPPYYYCRCNRCHTTSSAHPSLVEAIRAWRHRPTLEGEHGI